MADTGYRWWQVEVGFAPGYSSRVTDIDGDGRPEYAAVEHGGQRLLVVDFLGRRRWEARLPNTDKHSTTAIEAGDIDGDGEAEVIVGEEPEGANNLLFFDKDGQIKRRVELPLGEKDYDGNAIDSFGLADVDGDGHRELIAAVNGGRVYAIGKDYRVLWETRAPYRFFEHFVHCGDLDLDGKDEVALSSSMSTMPPSKEQQVFSVFDHDGRIMWTKDLAKIGPDNHVDDVIIGNIEGGGRNTLLTATGGCLFDAEGNEIWNLRSEINHGQWCDVADVRPDFPGKEVLISELWRLRQPLILASSRGEVIWRYEVLSPNARPTRARFIDWHGDGRRKIIWAEQPADCEPLTRQYRITVIDPDGSVRLVIPYEDTSLPGWFYNFENMPVAIDVDANGREEFVFATRTGKLMVVGAK